MAEKPTYEELKRRVKQLEKELTGRAQTGFVFATIFLRRRMKDLPIGTRE